MAKGQARARLAFTICSLALATLRLRFVALEFSFAAGQAGKAQSAVSQGNTSSVKETYQPVRDLTITRFDYCFSIDSRALREHK